MTQGGAVRRVHPGSSVGTVTSLAPDERETRDTMDDGPPWWAPRAPQTLSVEIYGYGLGFRGLLEISRRPIADRIAITAPLFSPRRDPARGKEGRRRGGGGEEEREGGRRSWLDYGQLVDLSLVVYNKPRLQQIRARRALTSSSAIKNRGARPPLCGGSSVLRPSSSVRRARAWRAENGTFIRVSRLDAIIL